MVGDSSSQVERQNDCSTPTLGCCPSAVSQQCKRNEGKGTRLRKPNWPNLLAVLLLWALAFNLLQLFVYRRLKRPRHPKDPTNTIRHIVEVMAREVATLPAPIPWLDLLDSS